jgi:hypothetical protein
MDYLSFHHPQDVTSVAPDNARYYTMHPFPETEAFDVSMKNETMAGVRRSDVKTRRPHSGKTYAQAARKQPKRGRVSFESETRKKHHDLTVKK